MKKANKNGRPQHLTVSIALTLSIALIQGFILTGCGSDGSTAGDSSLNTSEHFSQQDFESGYDKSPSILITLNGDSASCSSNAVTISGTTVTIKDEGTYLLQGNLNDGMVIINTSKDKKTQLVLDGVTIHSEDSAPIYILQSDKVFITLAEDSENTLSNGGSFRAIDDNNIDAVIYSKEDVTLNGIGSLTINSPGGHGIVSKDSLTISGGTFHISSASHGLAGKDDIEIADGTFTINSDKDGIHAENNDDASSGSLSIEKGTFLITSEGDGISASSTLQIADGSFQILAGGGSENGKAHSSGFWGNSSKSDSDSISMKGIKSGDTLTISGGTFVINSADDAIHSNTSAKVTDGTFEIATGDDGFHAEENLDITGGHINISESYEGLEALHVHVAGGNITLTTSDDGINAAGGTDGSGFGGWDAMGGAMPGGKTGPEGRGGFGGKAGPGGGGPGGFGGMGSGSSDGSITISDGNLNITASGDGLDANGTLEITGGYTIVTGPTQGDTATLDYDISGTISGGTFIGTGSAGMMAQSFSQSPQGVLAVKAGNQAAGTLITLTDAEGNVVLNHTPTLSFNVVILSSPDILSGETYTLTVGELSGDFTIE